MVFFETNVSYIRMRCLGRREREKRVSWTEKIQYILHEKRQKEDTKY